MPVFKVTVLIEKDGIPLDPLVRRVEVDESQAFDYTLAGTGDPDTFFGSPTGELDNGRLLLLATDHDVTLHLNPITAPDYLVPLLAGGFLLLVNANLANGPLIDINNAADPAVIARIQGFAGGT